MPKKLSYSLYMYHRMLWESSDSIRKINGNPSQLAAEILLHLSQLAEENSALVTEIEYQLRLLIRGKKVLGVVSQEMNARHWRACQIIDTFISVSSTHAFQNEIKAVRRILARLRLSLLLDNSTLLGWIYDLTHPDRRSELERERNVRIIKERAEQRPSAVHALKMWSAAFLRKEGEDDEGPPEEQHAIW